MTITTLKAAPHLYQPTLSLIEKSFHYQKDNSFAVDFAPLIDESNFHNCFILIDESENVIAHIGVCERQIHGSTIAMLGGIAVDESRRGEGYFQELMQDVIAEKRSDVACFMLWSDQEKLYKKYGFHLCGTQLEISQSEKPKNYTKIKLNALTEKQLSEVKDLYNSSFAKTYSTPERNENDWKLLAKITSSDLYIKEENNQVVAYFFMNKGQDLQGIIFEYGSKHEIKNMIQDISAYGKVWIGSDLIPSDEIQFQFFMAPADTRLFAEFIHKYTNGKINIRDINPMKQEVYFYFSEELLSLEVEDFLRGVFGPGIFEEIEPDIKPIFISGLVSI